MQETVIIPFSKAAVNNDILYIVMTQFEIVLVDMWQNRCDTRVITKGPRPLQGDKTSKIPYHFRNNY